MRKSKIKIIFFDVGSVLLRRKEDFDLLAANYLGVDFVFYKEKILEIIESEECRKRYRAISNLDQEHKFQAWINKSFSQRVIDEVRQIPKGRASSYGRIAKSRGLNRGEF